MKILFITHYVDLYGANRSLLALLHELSATHRCTCKVVVPRTGPLTERLDAMGIGHLVVDLPWWFINERALPFKLNGIGRARVFQGWLKREFAAVRQLSKLVKEQKFDLIHTNSSVVATGFFLSKATGIPHVWHLREFATLDYNLQPIAGMRWSQRILDRSAGVICVSEAIRQHFRIGERAGVRVIYNGVAPRAFIDQHAVVPNSLEEAFSFCMAGVVSPLKGHAEAVRALALVVAKSPAARLHILGDGAVEELKALVAELGLQEHVYFHGYVNDVHPHLQRSHVLLMCSRNEAMGRVTAEAMCAGKPVIGYNAGGTAELVDDGVNGLLYTGDHTDLADRMLRLIEDRALYETLSTNAINKARASFSNEAYGQAVHEVYRAVLAQRGRA